jgi:hypothetical protein
LWNLVEVVIQLSILGLFVMGWVVTLMWILG